MGFKYTGDSVLGVSLTVNTPKPLDNRTVVDKESDLYSISKDVAYEGMTVSNILNGNIYMLVDKLHLTDKTGWKASYEAILIITCTEDDYKKWSANTTEDFQPINPDETYLHLDTYYYIYEDSISSETEDLQYLSASWGKLIEEQLKGKALNTTVVALQELINADIQNLANNYITSEEIASKYALLSSLNLEDPESLLSKALSNYYTKEETDEIFVTKESLRGEGIEGDDFVFVTKTLYDLDLQAIQEELDKTLKVDGDGLLESITVKSIKSPLLEDLLLTVNVKPDGLYIEENKVAVQSEIPSLETITEEEYTKLEEEGSLKEDTYYYLYDVENNLKYVTKEYLEQEYHTRNLYLSWVAEKYYSKELVDELIRLAVESLLQQIDELKGTT